MAVSTDIRSSQEPLAHRLQLVGKTTDKETENPCLSMETRVFFKGIFFLFMVTYPLCIIRAYIHWGVLLFYAFLLNE